MSTNSHLRHQRTDSTTINNAKTVDAIYANFLRKGLVAPANCMSKDQNDSVNLFSENISNLRIACHKIYTDRSAFDASLHDWKDKSITMALKELEDVPPRYQKHFLTVFDNIIEEINRLLEVHSESSRTKMLKKIDIFEEDTIKVVSENGVKTGLEAESTQQTETIMRENLERIKQEHYFEASQLKNSNHLLERKIEELENAGGKEQCDKLKQQLKEYKSKTTVLTKKNEGVLMELQYNTKTLKSISNNLDCSKKTMQLHKAMYQREIQQLLNVIHLRDSSFNDVKEAYEKKYSCRRNPGKSHLSTYDPYSTRAIMFKKENAESNTHSRKQKNSMFSSIANVNAKQQRWHCKSPRKIKCSIISNGSAVQPSDF